MKGLRFCFIALLILIVCQSPCAAQEQEPLRADWLTADYKSIELVSLLASPAPLTTQKIRDVLSVGDGGKEEELGFGAITFDITKGHGYTALYVEGFAFRGTIGFYKLGIRASRESWPRIRECVTDLWIHNHGPDFTESDIGLVHEEIYDDVFLRYKSAVSWELGEMKLLEIPGELKKQYDYLISPIESRGIGTRDGEMAIDALVKANRVDLIENVLRGFSPSGRVYAALALLKLSRDNQLVLSPDTLGTILKIRNQNIAITRVRGCIVSYTTANEILNEAENPEPQLPQTEQSFAPMLSTTSNPSVKEGGP